MARALRWMNLHQEVPQPLCINYCRPSAVAPDEDWQAAISGIQEVLEVRARFGGTSAIGARWSMVNDRLRSTSARLP